MQFPEHGFYYHYKHDASKDFNNYSYEVVGTAWHTENEHHLIVYRPLYGNREYLQGAHFGAQPLSRWQETVGLEGKTVLRFTRITDPTTLEKLKAIRKEIYGT